MTMFKLSPRTITELHNVWESYNVLLEEQANTAPFGSYFIDNYASDNETWDNLKNMTDNWTAYSMIADMYK